jgi:hypothetical protein
MATRGWRLEEGGGGEILQEARGVSWFRESNVRRVSSIDVMFSFFLFLCYLLTYSCDIGHLVDAVNYLSTFRSRSVDDAFTHGHTAIQTLLISISIAFTSSRLQQFLPSCLHKQTNKKSLAIGM